MSEVVKKGRGRPKGSKDKVPRKQRGKVIKPVVVSPVV
jgi:hypothetical protein